MDQNQLPVWSKPSKLVVGIDIGTTFSGVAYAHLSQGFKPFVARVTNWPHQNISLQSSKVPSLLWYDSNGEVVKIGADAENQDAEDAEDLGWRLAEHFKLQVHPSDLGTNHKPKKGPVPIRKIYVDFLKYLIKHTEYFFKQRDQGGASAWSRLFPTMELILTHPNGWGPSEQKLLGDAAVEAKIITGSNIAQRIKYLTEAEASVHFCLFHPNRQGPSNLKHGTKIAVCDAGGSTVDITSYEVVSNSPILKLNETQASACIQAGAIFVDAEVNGLIKRTLAREGISDESTLKDYARAGEKSFIQLVKTHFGGDELAPTEDVQLKIGERQLRIGSVVRSGKLKVKGNDIKTCFDSCVNRIRDGLAGQIAHRGQLPSYIFLVGGFGESPYLKKVLEERFGTEGVCQLITCNDNVAKAVADGAVIWEIQQGVQSRATRYAYGIKVQVPYEPSNVEHRGRQTHVDLDGRTYVSSAWSEIVAKASTWHLSS
ncbi:unnamed protein product [Rhizoctonia solani]|uniref:Heat shock 70 kDa protein 12A n=1 Tax=Rhizoctonia solani TaxID=456999 RepID=A0A8H3GHF4_9AGAM|nr:unnamed protein product [Rhizoctonia solani]